ncbi:RNA 2',3'-cyclic phosphodiesterase [Sulfuriflexus mobilis]|uniref:RNA 2',3'-cyclic phosphodiesterase n=1 Tax=Sulfuriflexus mobilis TaxID=1811807 RepID=UPI000F829148|nr:RNA 2',3'-cyclic phosphodiesterase [Sulfuriflexus mobilis]
MPRPEQPKQQQPKQLNRQRLFFALWPDDAVRGACAGIIKQARNNHDGKAVQLNNLHITLAFLGYVSEAQRECVEAAADAISMAPFDLRFDHVGWFKRPKVLWLGAHETPEALLQLVADLNRGVRGCDIELDERPFATHLTLMRKVREFNEMETEPIDWRVDRFCLVQSLTHREGVEYQVVKSWQ